MTDLDDLSARLAAIAAKTPGQQRRLAEILARVEDVEPMDLTEAAETLIEVPWTTPTTDENAFARTLELAGMRDRVLKCRVYWGSHGCMHPRGHSPEIRHQCDCCTCEQHPDEDSGCVAGPPWYGEHTKFFGEDAVALGLPLVGA